MSDAFSERSAAEEASRRGRAAGYQPDWDDDEPDYTETKSFFRTSEFWFAMLGVAAILLAAYSDGGDSISREDGWRFATALGVGYVVSRGLAKAGSKEPTDNR